jgi:hypothetical protein
MNKCVMVAAVLWSSGVFAAGGPSFRAPLRVLAQLTPPAPLGPTTSPPGSDGDPMRPTQPVPAPGMPPGGDPGMPGNGMPGNGTPVNPPPSPMNSQLDQAEQDDNGRGFELVWLRAEAGFSHINMASFSAETLALQNTSSAGGVFGVSAGVRFVLLTLGARLRSHQLSAFSLWQINGVLGIAIPISSLDFSITAHGGYSFVGRLGSESVSAADSNIPDAQKGVSVTGFNAGVGAALDYYVTPMISIGGGVTGEALFLKRPPAEIPASVPADVRMQIEQSDLYKNSGKSVGFGFAAGARIGFHFGI